MGAQPVAARKQALLTRRDRVSDVERLPSRSAEARRRAGSLPSSTLSLHRCLHGFQNHRILKRHEVVEGSLFERILAEECEYPSGTDLLTARKRDVLSR